jgi:hypothetical protein
MVNTNEIVSINDYRKNNKPPWILYKKSTLTIMIASLTRDAGYSI